MLGTAIHLLLAATSEGPPAWLLLLGPAGAGGTYYALWQYYRNTDKSHAFEMETRIEAQSITGNEAKVNEITGTRNPRIEGDNESDYRSRVQPFG